MTNTEITEKELLKLITEFSKLIYGNQSLTQHEIQSCINDVFMSISTKIKSGHIDMITNNTKYDYKYVKGYVFMSIRNQIYKALNKKNKLKLIKYIDNYSDYQQSEEMNITDIFKIEANLTELEAKIFKMVVDGDSHTQIGADLGITKGSVFNHLRNARKKIKKELYNIK